MTIYDLLDLIVQGKPIPGDAANLVQQLRSERAFGTIASRDYDTIPEHDCHDNKQTVREYPVSGWRGDNAPPAKITYYCGICHREMGANE